jgi:hypothetical protein
MIIGIAIDMIKNNTKTKEGGGIPKQKKVSKVSESDIP